ncbi:MAG: hypothetical protein NVS1B11_17390 [Terriglobales bacterium]
MTHVATMLQTPLLSIERFDHPQNEVHVDGQLEVSAAYKVTFLLFGEFRIVRNSGAWDFAPGDVLLSCPGVSQRPFHPADGARDECLSIRFENDLVEDALGTLPQMRAVPKAYSSARSAFQVSMISDALQAQDCLMVEELALAAAQTFVPDAKESVTWSSIERSYGWYRVRMQRICDLLTRQYARRHSLSGLAKVAQMSPFHLNRVFHYMMGTPLHHYVIRLRLASAGKGIRAGQSVTDAAYAAGFNSVSFFSRSFRRHFGVAPIEYGNLTPHSQSGRLFAQIRGGMQPSEN